MLHKTITLAALATTLLAGAGTAQANVQNNESRIRCVDSNTLVVGRLGEPMFFTITGLRGDHITTPFYSGPIQNAPNVIGRVNHSGGQTSYRFCVGFRPAWIGQTITVSRNGSLIDSDRIVCW